MSEPREVRIEKLLTKARALELPKLALLCERFLNCRKKYLNGDGDVIFGLQNLDEIEKEIINLTRKLKI